MATLRICITLLLLGVAPQLPAQTPRTAELPPNVFESGSPPWSYYQWWRPLRVVFEDDTVLQIKQRIAAVSSAQVSSIDLDQVLGEHASSDLLFPVLATEGERGVRILQRLLDDYGSARPLDDRWLLILATLGRIPLPESQQSLDRELNRILQEYDFSDPSIPVVDAYTPIGDALLACMAGQALLTSERIEQVVRRMPARKDLFWVIGLEWARALMREDDLFELVEEYLISCDDRDLLKATNHEVASGRVRGIISFLSSPRDVWPFTRAVMLRPVDRRKVVDKFLAAQYLGVLSLSAEVGSGVYEIDRDVMDKLLSVELVSYRGVAVSCWLLSHYQPSIHSPRWEVFLAKHAAHLDERDRASAQYTVDRVFGRVELPAGVKISYDRIEPPVPRGEPGVHILGFRRAGGRHPTIRVPEPKQD